MDKDHERARWKVGWAVPARAAGGTARAAALSVDERREIARKAVKARWAKHLPQATHEGVIRFGDIEVEVAVLGDGQRLVTQNGFMVGLGRIRTGKGHRYFRARTNLPGFLTVQNLKPFVTEDLAALASQIEFRTKQGLKTFGYAANFLPKVCELFERAQHAGVLKDNQRNIAKCARTIAEQLRRSGTMRLIDEATGYRDLGKQMCGCLAALSDF
ncbi:hypothetical protein JQ617_09945 [Bradyrhizobium sp. KB893862 SZCCT0404]|uniref:hypothetical protein n=1 Tax=Bradyrhizobium sp. KB893862 SZCCT0404 TaxID=2807672 RepID=UPI001BA54939|nr:hypothetical protein [Bradyrhizobium sp. KB893862 SZCCT0404]MBR1174275.1 hypothetical protein [Bradyrhizobium sp. KB893862 SZCCT0404]